MDTENTSLTPLNKILVGGLIVLITHLTVNFFQGRQRLTLEKEQFESTLIVNAIEKGDIEASRQNIEFLINSGLISQSNNKIVALLGDTTFKAKFPEKVLIELTPTNTLELAVGLNKIDYSYASRLNYISKIRGRVVDDAGAPIFNAAIYINPCKSRPNNSIENCFAKTHADENGLFWIITPNKGTYELLITAPRYSVISKRYSSNQILPNDLEFILSLQ